jgi:hypothetical protein
VVEYGLVAAVRVGKLLIIILRVLDVSQANLFQITGTAGAPRIFASTGKDREQDRSQYCYYGYDD